MRGHQRASGWRVGTGAGRRPEVLPGRQYPPHPEYALRPRQATDILTGPYTEQEFWEDLLRVTGGETDEELARHMIGESKDILNWIVEQGVRWQPSLGGTLSLGRTNSFFLGGGRAMLNALYLTA